MLGADKEFITDTASVGWRLEIASTSNGRTIWREVVIAVPKGDLPPYRVLYVGDPAFPR